MLIHLSRSGTEKETCEDLNWAVARMRNPIKADAGKKKSVNRDEGAIDKALKGPSRHGHAYA